MGNESDKIRQENNKKNRESANRWKRIAEEKKDKYDKNQEKLDRLKKARKKLNKKEKDFSDFKKEVSNYPEKLSKANFKGDLRDKFDSKVEGMEKKLNTELNSYQTNLSKLDATIAKLELEQGDLKGAISSALSMMENFLSSIF